MKKLLLPVILSFIFFCCLVPQVCFAQLNYCNPAANQPDPCNYGWINNVSLGNTINKSSGCSGGYADYTSTDTLIAVGGQSINFSVADGSTNAWSQFVFIFIDYNQDGDFDDAGEKVADGYYMDPFGTNATGTFNIPSLLPGGSYRIRVICDTYNTLASACNTDLGEAEDYVLTIPQVQSCIPVISQPCDMWISNVTIGTINNTTPQPLTCTAGGYTDYNPALTATAGPGQNVNYSISGTATNFTNQFADIYVDYNADGDFDDAGEQVAGFIFLGYAGENIPGSFVIPANQPYGFYRIRVKSYSINEISDGPCGNNINGETEDYRLLVTCVSNGSAIVLKGNNLSIADGDNSPSATDSTDFGNVEYSTSATHTFTIENPGTGILNLSAVTISGPDASYYTVLSQPAASVAPGGSTTFAVQFSPAYLYNYYATVHVGSDNCSIADYDFAILGTGSCSLNGPEINIQGNNTDIAGFDYTPSLDDHTDFGNVASNSTASRTFTIQNLGTQVLNIADPVQLYTFDGPLQFAVTSAPAASVAPGGSTTFTISFTPVSLGFKYAYVRVNANDCDEPFYDFEIAGTAECSTIVPEINIKGNGMGIVDGSTTTSVTDNTDFGVTALNTSITKTFTIENNGVDPLNISGIDFSGSNAAAFSVITAPEAVVAPGDTTVFTVQFTPLVSGEETAVIHIHNSDCDEGDYDFVVKGTDGTHCTPLILFPCSYVWINSVVVGTINNTSDCTGGYTDNSATASTVAHAGETVNFTIGNGGFVGAYMNIYADFNKDGDFEDVGEQLTSMFYVEAGTTTSGSFIIPLAQDPGDYRLRIVSDYFGYSSTIPCSSNNGEIEDYTLTVQSCIPGGSIMIVKGNDIIINDGDTTPDINDGTDYGTVAMNMGYTHTFTIENPGTAALNIDAVNFTGADANAFSVISQPSISIAPGGNSSFTVEFSTTEGRIHNAVMHIISSNGCESLDYDIALQGTSIELIAFNLKVFLEGYYIDFNTMRSAKYDLGMSEDPTATDDITVNLWSPTSLSNPEPDYSATALLHTNGIAEMQFPAAVMENGYYIAVKHRNHIETWSKLPVVLAPVSSYDFTTGQAQAYDNGTNLPMSNMGNGVFAIYGGDVDQNGGVDASDISMIDNDANEFAFGYNASDVTGDGATDASDLAVVENNQQLFLFYARPF